MARALGRFAGTAPVLIRIIVGSMMFVHGLEKIGQGPAGFGQFLGLAVILLGPGRPSMDHLLRLETAVPVLEPRSDHGAPNQRVR